MLAVHEVEERVQMNPVGDLADLAADVEATLTALVTVHLHAGRITCEVLSLVPFGFDRDSVEPVFSALRQTVEARVKRELCDRLND